MDKNKIEQKKPGSNQKGVEEDSPLRLTADLEGNYLLDERTSEMKWLGIFYSPAGGSVHRVAKILKKKIGADKVIYPEHSMGVRVARNLLSSGFIDMFELSSDFSMAEFKIPQEWIGKTLRDLKIREKYHINLIGLKQGERINMNVQPDKVLPADCTIVAAGANSDLNKVSGN